MKKDHSRCIVYLGSRQKCVPVTELKIIPEPVFNPVNQQHILPSRQVFRVPEFRAVRAPPDELTIPIRDNPVIARFGKPVRMDRMSLVSDLPQGPVCTEDQGFVTAPPEPQVIRMIPFITQYAVDGR